ncbi:hypothetical protein [Glaciimonas immobilis]|uniref:Secreted protein n=1 Tax=Glaciimonas immobilis TaxID=728004 RepID=A0A840RR09_9BURK|nr:hypothetical protein [Glaciimonas immobilis]KAF3999418.1 hypothetical protein HAV38_05720 [Glaciimonas immobilis]MBB5198919.1 hypothetical protein [Glaciimonas immobilis]
MTILQNILGAFAAILFISIAGAMTTNGEDNTALTSEEIAAEVDAQSGRCCKPEQSRAEIFPQTHWVNDIRSHSPCC